MTKIMTLKTISMALLLHLSICRCDELTEEATISGFTVNLIHKDSPHSPSYDPSSPPFLRLANSLRRSFTRMRYLNTPSSLTPQPHIINSGGEYFMQYSIGTPPQPSLGTADTASDVTWTQCHPCRKCFNQSFPIFAPKRSSTYRNVRCNSPQCAAYRSTACSRNRRNCRYSEIYGDGSFSSGKLAKDTVKLGAVSVPRIVFGCGSRNSDPFPAGESGIVGLGGGRGSLISQLGRLAQGKFSYCLVSLTDSTNSSKLNFGAAVEGRGAVATPLVRKSPDTFYYLTLEGISVGNRRLEFYDSSTIDGVEAGNVIIDSGTTLTLLPARLYAEVERAVRRRIKLKAVGDPLGVLRLCFLSRGDLGIDDVTVHFRGADVRLREENVFVRTAEDTVCLAAAPAPAGGVAVYGNLAQVNFLVGYDLVKRRVSFKRADCVKQ